MDGRSVLLEISFAEGFHRRRTALAWVDKPRAGESFLTVTLSYRRPMTIPKEKVKSEATLFRHLSPFTFHLLLPGANFSGGLCRRGFEVEA